MTTVADALYELVAPLVLAFEDVAHLQMLLRELGFDFALVDEHLAAIRSGVSVVEAIEGLASVVESGGDPRPAVEEMAAALRAVGSIDPGAIASLPGELSDPVFWQDLALELPNYLLVTWLDDFIPTASALLELGGALVVEPWPSSGVERRRLDWGALGALLTNPPSQLRERWGFGGDFDHAGLLEAARRVAATLDLRVVRVLRDGVTDVALGPFAPQTATSMLSVAFLGGSRGRESPATSFGALVTPATSSADGVVSSLGILPWLTMEGATEWSEGDWTFRFEAEGEARGPGFVFHPEAVDTLAGAGAQAVTLTVAGAPSTPWILFGDAEASHLRVEGAALAVSADTATGDVSLAVDVSDAVVVALTTKDADGFIAALLDVDVEARGGMRVAWSATAGLSWSGEVGVGFEAWLGQKLGPLTVESVRGSIAAGESGAEGAATVDLTAALGPFDVAVRGIGVAASVASASATGNFGPLEVETRFVPPTALGLAFEAGPIEGGGELGFDAALARYSGSAVLTAFDVGVAALAVIDTAPGAWSMFLSIAADLPSIPLGFGFTLEGVGGLVAVNRTFDANQMASGLRDGRLDQVMFPDDPTGDVAALIASIDTFFPPSHGEFTFAPMIKVGWGAPTIVTGELGIIISVPSLAIAVLGELDLELADEAGVTLVEFHLGVLGAIDIAEGTMWVTASVFDSQIVGIDVGGDAAAYVRVSQSPFFLLSVGGFHPGWSPPSGLPAAVTQLRRVFAAIPFAAGVDVRVEAYVAVTSNTLQFGGGLYAEASVRVVGIDFSAQGWFEIHVLMTFSPLRIVADASAGVEIRAKGKTLVGVELELHFEGPRPWFASGKARFKFLGATIKLGFEVGGRAQLEAPRSHDVLNDVVRALEDERNWTARGSERDVVTTSATGSDALVVPPRGVVEARQSVAPLNEELEKFGAMVPDGPRLLEITDVAIGGDGMPWETAREAFAPAQFFAMTNEERLAAPSFEELDAGLAIGSDDLATVSRARQTTDVEPGWETSVWEPSTSVDLGRLPSRGFSDWGGSKRGMRKPGEVRDVSGRAPQIEAERFSIVDPTLGTEIETHRTFIAARRATHRGRLIKRSQRRRST